MTQDISYTPEEVAKILKISRFTVYELIKRGELTAYKIGRKVRVEAGDLEVYKQRGKGLMPAAAVADTPKRDLVSPQDGLIICGQDLVLEVLTRHLEKQMPHIRFLRNYIGSIDGLMALYRGAANLVTAHLWDSDTNQYNIPYVRRLLPGHRSVLVNLVYRDAGFYVAQGNPREIHTWSDLAKSGVRFVNRERGSGARVLLDEQLRVHNIEHSNIKGYEHEEMSHLAVASCVARGEADVGLGIEKAARQVSGIEFLPLHRERYDMVVRKEDFTKPHFQAVMAVLRSSAFRNEVAGLGGYDISHMGEIIAEL
ncbi:MAG: helix-turn-helix transcriptional regulator [Bacillota bacterium]